MQREEKLIEIRNATVWRGATQVFDGLNLQAAARTDIDSRKDDAAQLSFG